METIASLSAHNMGLYLLLFSFVCDCLSINLASSVLLSREIVPRTRGGEGGVVESHDDVG